MQEEKSQIREILPEEVIRVRMLITFLRLNFPASVKPPVWDPAFEVRKLSCPTPDFYRFLYRGVGHNHIWWIRYGHSDEALNKIILNPRVHIFVLYQNEKPAGFFELEEIGLIPAPEPHFNLQGNDGFRVHLCYFGLLPDFIGKKLGLPFLQQAVVESARLGAQILTVNTCTADHPAALGNYKKAGFREICRAEEIHHVPVRLNLPVPEEMKITC